jgi:hypothetical protein
MPSITQVKVKHHQLGSSENEKEVEANRVNTTRVVPCVAHAYASQEQEEILEKEQASK